MLNVENVSIAYEGKTVVNQVNFCVNPRETVCIVGESGSGKSTVLKAILGLLGPDGSVVSGSISFDNTDLLSLKPKDMRAYRGAVIATVAQQAGRSMDPITKIGSQFHEALLTKMKISRRESDERAIACMSALSLKEPERILNSYPVMLSGGTNQRVALAMAMVMEPRLILADEPTSALDVTVQVEVVRAMQELKKQCDAAILLVTHNIGVVAQMADHVGVMYKGDFVEWGTKDQILKNPLHPYTVTLMNSILKMDGRVPGVKTIYRQDSGSGCAFYQRCEKACERCRDEKPTEQVLADGHKIACHLGGM